MVDAILIKHLSIRRNPLRPADIAALRGQWPYLEEFSIEPPMRDSAHEFDETYPWAEAKSAQRDQYRAVLDALRDNPDAALLYMGFAAVPLAVHLGALIGQTQRVQTFQYHPERQDWKWPKFKPTRQLVQPVNGPRADASSERDVLIRVSCCHPIHPSKTRALAGHAHEYDLALANPQPAAVASPADLEQLGREFRRTLDKAKAEFPSSRMIHLAAAVPVGAALTLGMQINPTTHLPIQTWKYLGNRERAYVRALCIGEFVPKPGILLLGAAPIDEPPISAPAEIQALSSMLERFDDRLRVVGRAAAGVAELTDLFGSFEPTVVYLASHGRDDDGVLPRALILSTPAGLSLMVELDDLIRSLQRAPKVLCVVVAACHSAPIAKQLINEVPTAVGFEGRLFDADARVFGDAFLSNLARHRSVAEAFDDAKLHIDECRRHQVRRFHRNDIDPHQLIPIHP